MKSKKYILAFYLFISCSNSDKEYDVIGVIQDIKEDQNTIILGGVRTTKRGIQYLAL